MAWRVNSLNAKARRRKVIKEKSLRKNPDADFGKALLWAAGRDCPPRGRGISWRPSVDLLETRMPTTIHFQGTEYANVEAMPLAVRAAFEKYRQSEEQALQAELDEALAGPAAAPA